MFNFSYQAITTALILLYTTSTFGQNTQVVVIPLLDDDIDQCVVSSACDAQTNQTTVTCPSGDTTIPCVIDDSNFRTVFVTSTVHSGDLGGLSGADAICQSRATESSLSGTYLAWLSSDLPSNNSPNSRFNQTGTFVDVLGNIIAIDYDQLTSGALVRPISVDNTGTTVFSTDITSAAVWTNTLSTGEPSSLSGSFSCNNFTSTSGNGSIGIYTSRDDNWSFLGQIPCDQELRLYCFEQ